MNSDARECIRSARVRRGLSLRELARRTGVSASLLSQIETGKTDPSVATLYLLVAELNLSLDALLDQPAVAAAETAAAPPAVAYESSLITPATPSRGASPVVSPGHRRILHMDSGVIWERLTSGPSMVADALLVTYEVGGSSSSSGNYMRHEGHELAYMLEGELTLQLGFEEYILCAGDSLEFPSTTPHQYVNKGTVPAKGLWFVYTGEYWAADRPEAPTGRLLSAVDVLHEFRRS